jgi:2-amino-4-deoxychorismate synthase
VYFYNTFVAHSPKDILESDMHPGSIAVCRDRVTGEVHAIRGRGFASVQFHPASIMTQNGVAILGELITALLYTPPRAAWPNLTNREVVA